MEGLDNIVEYMVEEKDEKYERRIPRWKYELSEICVKGLFLIIGVLITILLYDKCLFNPNCNTIVTIHFSIIALTCFLQAGMSIDKLANVKLT